MSEYVNFASFAFAALFFIIDPVGNVPLFLAITQQNTMEERRQIVKKATIAAFCILAAFLLAGRLILEVFHITMGAFKIAGGIVIFIISLQMLFALRPGQKTSPREKQEAVEKDDVSIFPLAIPFLSGPGAIAAVIMLRADCKTVTDYVLILGVIGIVSALTFVILRESQYLMQLLGQTGVNILTRLMGLILSVVAVQFVIDGLKLVVPDVIQRI